MENPLNVDKSGLRNRLHQESKDDKENHSENEFEFEAPSLVSNHSDVDETDNCAVGEGSIDLIDLNTDLNGAQDVDKQTRGSLSGDHVKRKQTTSSNTKFGTDNNFRFNFQMPKIIKTPDKVDEAKENFLDTVQTPSKRLQAQPENTEHKKVRLEQSTSEPNWNFIRATFFITLLLAAVKLLFILWRNDYSILDY